MIFGFSFLFYLNCLSFCSDFLVLYSIIIFAGYSFLACFIIFLYAQEERCTISHDCYYYSTLSVAVQRASKQCNIREVQ